MTREEVSPRSQPRRDQQELRRPLLSRRRIPSDEQIVPMHLAQLDTAACILPAAATVKQPYQIIGVVGDVRNDGLPPSHTSRRRIFRLRSCSGRSVQLIIRTSGDPLPFSCHAISTNIRTLNQNQAVSFVYSMDDYLSTFVWSQDRFLAVLFGIFSFVALGLALSLGSRVSLPTRSTNGPANLASAWRSARRNRTSLWLTLLATIQTTSHRTHSRHSCKPWPKQYHLSLDAEQHAGSRSSCRHCSPIFLIATAAACLPARAPGDSHQPQQGSTRGLENFFTGDGPHLRFRDVGHKSLTVVTPSACVFHSSGRPPHA